MSCIALLYLAGLGLSAGAFAQAAGDDPDALYRKREDVTNARKAAAVWAARAASGKDYEASWKLARANFYIAGTLPEKEAKVEYEHGMAAGKQAVGLNADKPEGHFWYAANMGRFAELGSMFTGLHYKDDVKAEFETVIKLSPGWQSASAESALGEWYLKVPGGFPTFAGGDNKKGIAWLRKALEYDPKSIHLQYVLGEALADDKKTRPEAKTLLQQVVTSTPDPNWVPEDKKYQQQAAALLAKLK